MNVFKNNYRIIGGFLAAACVLLGVGIGGILLDRSLKASLDRIERETVRNMSELGRAEWEFSHTILETANFITYAYPSLDAQSAQRQRVKLGQGKMSDFFAQYHAGMGSSDDLRDLKALTMQAIASIDEVIRLKDAGTQQYVVLQTFQNLERLEEDELHPAFLNIFSEESAVFAHEKGFIENILYVLNVVFGILLASGVWIIVSLAASVLRDSRAKASLMAQHTL